ncbi:Ni/Fe hydrogenase subunit alpha [Legionella sp. W05-934-2]|uniref:Ni/Fe hydrogenase subunit alpha n=1 Tax=Legionella sp. W05-934-2 TaxID=1198649 RepID=UPI0034628EAE
MNKKININVPVLARVEGEGALDLTIHGKQLEKVHLKIYEPPRLFEKFLEGRSYDEILDMVARICGICPVAYQMSAVHAIEQCFATKTTPWVREMRRLFYCGEWLESHSLHIHLLALPDFLGFHSAPEMAHKYPDEIKRGLRLQSYGNSILRLLGGRAVHPVGACVGGFFKAPSMHDVHTLLGEGEARLADCEALIRFLATLNLPDHHLDLTTVSLYHPQEYPMCEGHIVSNRGLNIPIEEYESYFVEHQVPHSTALHALLNGKPYLVGPLARVNNCFGHLPEEIHLLLQQLNLNFPANNMCHSIIARAIEVYYAVLESIRIMRDYQPTEAPHTPVEPKAGEGFGCTEAPRGLLWKHFRLDDKGLVTSSRIIPPTSQNQAQIEHDLRESLIRFGLNRPENELRHFSELLIRNYDPCISCSTHFLNLTIDRQ